MRKKVHRQLPSKLCGFCGTWGKKKGEGNVPRYSAVHKSYPTGTGFSLPRKRTDASGQFSCKGDVYPESRSPAGSARSCSMGCGLQGAAGELSELDLAPETRHCGHSSKAGVWGVGTSSLPGTTSSAHGAVEGPSAEKCGICQHYLKAGCSLM